MVLADTSVWVYHLRRGLKSLEQLLLDGHVVCHPFVIGELACGQIKNRAEILSLLKALPQIKAAEEDEIFLFIEHHALMGRGLGWVDMHMLTSALISKAALWTLDKRLQKAASEFKVSYLSHERVFI